MYDPGAAELTPPESPFANNGAKMPVAMNIKTKTNTQVSQ